MITKEGKRYLVCTNVLKENCLKHNLSFDTLKSVLSVINNSLNRGLGHHIGWDLKTSNIYNMWSKMYLIMFEKVSEVILCKILTWNQQAIWA